jgi:aryl-alcohol dehydrogenase-like predicted oxidoreductase
MGRMVFANKIVQCRAIRGARLEIPEATRREFLKGVVICFATDPGAERLFRSAVGEAPPGKTQDMPYRQLGKTGEKVSCIGLGGFHLGQPQLTEAQAIQLFHAAIDRGINFSDNSWDYYDGESERRVGKALKGYRQKVFVMTKFDGRTKVSALRQLDESLQRLQVDHVELWQFHENIRLEDPDRFFAVGGAAEAMEQARRTGKVRYFGFTGHKDPSVHLRMLELAEKHHFHFDTAQMPINVMDAHFRSFEHQVVPVLMRQGVALLGMKSMGDKNILKSNTVTPLQCLQYALSRPTSVVITGIDSMQVLNQAFEAASSYSSLSSADIAAILKTSTPAAVDGKYEPFKTSTQFDSTAQHPEWLGENTST